MYGGAADLIVISNIFPFAYLPISTYIGVSRVKSLGVFFEDAGPELHGLLLILQGSQDPP